jgi:hypothetical protein
MSQRAPPPSFVDPKSAVGLRRIQAAADLQASNATHEYDEDDEDAEDADPQTQNPAVKPPSTTASKMPASFKNSVQLLTALSNLKKMVQTTQVIK